MQICSQLSERLEKQQTAHKEEISRIKVCFLYTITILSENGPSFVLTALDRRYTTFLHKCILMNVHPITFWKWPALQLTSVI